MIRPMRLHPARGRNIPAAILGGLWFAVAGLLPFAAVGESPWRIEGARRVVAFADVHGAHDELVALLRSQGILDGALRWSGADTHLVSLGDLLDRGPDSRRVLDLLMRLEGEAHASGGGSMSCSATTRS